MVRNNNRIAAIYGYRNYYEYAYQNVYQRDYDMTQIGKLRQYAAEYLPAVCQEATKAFETVYESLSYEDSSILSSYVYDDYSRLDSNYVRNYIADMPQSSGEMMQDMFDRERVIFTDYGESYQGAFTTWIDGEPFCFFGQGYSNSETVIHELGHYYGSMYVEAWSQPMDLSETQSQSNEWLFVDYLQSVMSEELYRALVEYKLSSDIGYIMCFVMIDEFEEKVYSQDNAGNLSLEEYDAIMAEIAEAYGGVDFIQENILDIQSYWKQVVLESPVYYVSYAVSGIAAINLYTMAQQDETAARESLRKLMEEPVEDEGFLVNIQNAGLSGPFDEEVYRQLMYRYTGVPGEII
jgi:oligoendopeptidase F